MKTVKVRIALAVDPTGAWNASGWNRAKDDMAMEMAVEPLADGEVRYWLTAEVAVPEIGEISGEVQPA